MSVATEISLPMTISPRYSMYQPPVSSGPLRQIMRLGYLLQKYTASSTPDTPVTSGGLQQYLNRLDLTGDSGCWCGSGNSALDTNSSPRNHSASHEFNYATRLPDSILLEIFSRLPAVDLCAAEQVSLVWSRVANDNLLWRHKLARDAPTWTTLGHNSNPARFADCLSDLSAKDIYLRCCPDLPEHLRPAHPLTPPSLRRALRNFFLPKRPPKLALVGPGLESKTSCVVRRIMQCKSDEPFRIQKMFQGSGGMGSGCTYSMTTRQPSNDVMPGSSMTSCQRVFDLSMIYSSSQRDREHAMAMGYSRRNKLFVQRPEFAALDDIDEAPLELTQSCKTFFQSLDGLIYAVDASQATTRHLEDGCREIHAIIDFINASCSSTKSFPLLVLALIPSEDSERVHSAMEIIDLLQLNRLSCVWQIAGATSDNLDRIPEAFSWIIESYMEN